MDPEIASSEQTSSGRSIIHRLKAVAGYRKFIIPVLLLLILPLIVYEVLIKHDDRQHASVIGPDNGTQMPIKILVLEYFPLSPSNSNNLDGTETGWGNDATVNGRTVQFWEQATDSMISTSIPLLNESSKYHGYKDLSAPAFLDYQVVDTKKFYTSIPRGVYLGTQSDGTARYRPYYAQILSNVNICNYVDNMGVQEVWMYGYHSKQIEPDESRMSSKYGDISNAYPKENTIALQYRMPDCSKAYTLYNFTYQPGGGSAIGNSIHNRIHQIENLVPFAEGKYPPIPPNQLNTNIPGSTFWGDFSEYVQNYTSRSGYLSSCGNAHYAPNWQNVSTDSYRYNLTAQASFNCETWNPDDSKTTYIKAGCERWGCTDVGFYKYFMQNIPGYNNGIIFNGKQMKNWWEAFYDFEAFIDNGHSLYGTSIISTPTPSPTPYDESYRAPINLVTEDAYIQAENFYFTSSGRRYYPDKTTLKITSSSFSISGGHMDFEWLESGKKQVVQVNFIADTSGWKVYSLTTNANADTTSYEKITYQGFDGGAFGAPLMADVFEKTSGNNKVHFENLNMLGFIKLTPTPTPTYTPTPTPIPTNTPTPTPVIFSAQVSVSPQSLTTSCPAQFKFTGVINSTEPGTVQWKWIRSDKASTPIQTTIFSSAGSKTVSTSWKLGSNTSRTFKPLNAWEAIQIISPSSSVSNKATFSLYCQAN